LSLPFFAIEIAIESAIAIATETASNIQSLSSKQQP